MLVQTTCRFEKEDDEAIEKIVIKEKIKKSAAIMKIFKLGLEAYFKKTETSDSGKIEKQLTPKFEELHEKIQALSTQMKDVDLKSYRMNLFITDFADTFFNEPDKLKNLNEGVKRKLESYQVQIKYIPKLGFIVLKHMKNILNKNIPDQFYSEIEDIYLTMNNKK